MSRPETSESLSCGRPIPLAFGRLCLSSRTASMVFLPLQFRPRCKIGSDMRHVEIQNPSKHGPAASLAAFDLYLNARDIGCVDLTKAIPFFCKSSRSLQPIWFTITIHAASEPTPTRYEAIKPELASFGFESKSRPNTTPKKPQGMALISVT